MEKFSFRDLRADEIECRVNMVKEDWLSLLLYKDARCDQNILDETVGPFRWQRDHFECKGNMYCKVGIRDDSSPDIDKWVWKADCGAESNTAAEKGEASDSFKRACVNWGIGRELYTSPFIRILGKDCNIKKNQKGKLECKDQFYVSKIKIESKKITGLAIRNGTTGKRVFVYVREERKTEAKPVEKDFHLEAKGINPDLLGDQE